MEIVSETMTSVGDLGSSLASLLASGAAGAVDQVVALLSPDSVPQLVLIVLGLVLLVYLVLCLVYHAVRGLYTFTLPSLVSMVKTPNLKDKYGAWAVVTGSTQVGRKIVLALTSNFKICIEDILWVQCSRMDVNHSEGDLPEVRINQSEH